TGVLDTTFNGNGKVITDLQDLVNAQPDGVLAQPDGKVVMAGTTWIGNFAIGNFALSRFNADGTLDTAFGIGCHVVTTFGGNDQVTGAVLQPDGKIVVVGETGTAPGGLFAFGRFDLALARYNPDGSLDSGFGTGGLVVTSFGSSFSATITDVALGADGKIVVMAKVNGGAAFNVLRYNPDGSLDAMF